ncbi:phosphomannomutase [Heterostelium album PN500]|uniref:Phosphomannomutase n=1 Tax=Heterostelium pallidum (strain ATCC 26659 / Pp 5 / PN500) TaxID=670386 RepID=D3B206_HETP5|nr:phosphomannomutase [Heterostelium album PN500]EFA85330.1 phosphomannomutase [Heterostelium album PN500]|eukprot:XP_020437439.1 phosphomannomutase [Heterostelium album PN500]
MSRLANTICLFDVDGTLTKPRNDITPHMKQFMRELKNKVELGVVGGSDLVKIQEQLGSDCLTEYDYLFAENGLNAFKSGQPLAQQSIKDFLGEENLKKFLNFVLRYLADIDIPIKRGTFIEFRNGMINISPIGRNCSQKERDEFEKYDKQHQVRSKMVSVLQTEFSSLGLKYSIGGQISFDVFPIGWDKTYCLRHLPAEQYKTIYFFGDKTFVGGNDYEISVDPRITKSFTVTSPEDTERFLRELFYQ